jgi:hypothetical protein
MFTIQKSKEKFDMKQNNDEEIIFAVFNMRER